MEEDTRLLRANARLLRPNMGSQTSAQARAYKGAYACKEIYSRLHYGAPIVRGRHTAAAAVPWAPTRLCLYGGVVGM